MHIIYQVNLDDDVPSLLLLIWRHKYTQLLEAKANAICIEAVIWILILQVE